MRLFTVYCNGEDGTHNIIYLTKNRFRSCGLLWALTDCYELLFFIIIFKSSALQAAESQSRMYKNELFLLFFFHLELLIVLLLWTDELCAVTMDPVLHCAPEGTVARWPRYSPHTSRMLILYDLILAVFCLNIIIVF